MKKIIFLITTLYLVNLINFANADSNIPLKKYLEKKDIEKGPAQVYLLNRCSAVYAYASAIILKTDVLTSKGFIEKANNLLFKSVELMVIVAGVVLCVVVLSVVVLCVLLLCF